ncbi:unnamed protein product [Callosobruchus maculatus]|uniref:Uncharacterized protein n=1 Tax=Callosobruchus maculatus TaxID=64391 RepID=A0A653D3I7_CALMS|nr:unnamed protein product [Callosobruchus maculatus]VEN54734.1 unnamed protein product [Callosobruchus maculatus]
MYSCSTPVFALLYFHLSNCQSVNVSSMFYAMLHKFCDSSFYPSI